MAIFANAQPAGTIEFSAAAYRVSEGDAATYDLTQVASPGGAVITVRRVAGFTGRILVDCVITNGTATNGVHFLVGTNAPARVVTNVLTLADLQTSTNFIISPINNAVTNAARTVLLGLVNLRLAPGQDAGIVAPTLGTVKAATLTIVDDEPGFNIERTFFKRSEKGGSIEIGVTLRGGGDMGVSVDYRTTDAPNFVLQPESDYATAGADYSSTSGTLDFPAGTQRAVITLPILADTLPEFNEDVQIQLRNPQGQVNGTDVGLGAVTQATVTILDDARTDADSAAGSASQAYNPPDTLNPNPGANNTVNAIAFDATGRAIIGGDFTSVNSKVQNRLARLTATGAFDSNFLTGTGPDRSVNAIASYSTGALAGRIIIGGSFSSFNGSPRSGVARVRANGSLDPTFAVGSGTDGPVYAALVQVDERVLIAGDFTKYNGTPRNRIARLNADGSLDTTFDPGVGPDGTIWAMQVSDAGQVTIGGEFTEVTGVPRVGVARLANTGALDETFDPGFGFDGVVYALALIPPTVVPVNAAAVTGDNGSHTNVVDTGAGSGNVTLGYDFGGATNSLRIYFEGVLLVDTNLISTGVVQVAYGPGTTTQLTMVVNEGLAPGTVWSYRASIFPNLADTGKLLVGGDFSSINGFERHGFARLNPDGAVDATFGPYFGANGSVYAIARADDGSIYLGGAFTRVNFTPRHSVTRLYANGAVDTTYLDTAYNQFAGLVDADGFVSCLGLAANGNLMIGGHFNLVGGGGDRLASVPRRNFAQLVAGATPGPGNVSFLLSNYSFGEMNGAAGVVMTRTNGALGQITLSAFTQEGLAKSGVDFLGSTQSVGWAALESVGNTDPIVFPFQLLDDTLTQGNRDLSVKLTNLLGTVMLGNVPIITGAAYDATFQTLVTIIDDDFRIGALGFAATKFTVNENDGSLVVTVVRSNGITGRITIDYTTGVRTNGSMALPGQDFVTTRGTLTFAPGQTTRTFTIPIIDNSTANVDRAFDLLLTNPRGGAELGIDRAVVTIVDNDFSPGRIGLEADKYAFDERDGAAVVVAQRSGGNVGALSVDYATVGGSAVAGVNFVAQSGRLTWGNGDAAPKIIRIPLIQDGTVAGPLVFSVLLSNPSLEGGLNSVTNAEVTIRDGDSFGALSFAASLFVADEAGTNGIVTVRRVGGSSGVVTVELRTQDRSGVAGVDYVGTTNTLTFGAGELSKVVQIPVFDRPLVSGDKEVGLVLTNVTQGTLGTLATAILRIVDTYESNIPAGSVDTAFRVGLGPDNRVNSVALQPDGKMVLVGEFTNFATITKNGIARINADGSLDFGFNTGAGVNGPIRAVTRQSDGRLLIAGLFTTYNGTNRKFLARLNEDGTLDGSFELGSGPDNSVFAMRESLVSGARKILVGGSFNTINSAVAHTLARLNDDGSMDATFSAGSGLDGAVYALEVLDDGRILVGGDFASYDGKPRARLAALRPNGDLDTAFGLGAGPNGPVRVVLQQLDGKVLIAGAFTEVDGIPHGGVARLNRDGTLDATFSAGTGANDIVLTAALQLDGKIVLGGSFTLFNRIFRHRLTRLNSDGSTDTTINFGLGANGFVSSLAVQPDRRIVVSGGFTQFNGGAVPYLTRIYGGAIAGPGAIEFANAIYTADESSTNALVTIRRKGGTTEPVTVDFATTPGTAVAGIDYANVTTTLLFAAGEAVRVVEIPVIDDRLVELDRTVNLALTRPTGGGTLGGQPNAELIITSDDSLVAFATGGYSASKNTPGGRADITVSRSGSANSTVTVKYTATAGTASPGQQFIPVSDVLTFAPGETSKTFSVALLDDFLAEGNKTVNLALSDPSNSATLGLSAAVLTIVDYHNAPGVVQFGRTSFVGSEAADQATITLVRTNGGTGVISVRIDAIEGTALRGSDYSTPEPVVTFADGEGAKTILLGLIDDGMLEGNEIFTVRLSAATGGASLGLATNAVVTILDSSEGVGFTLSTNVVDERSSIVGVSVDRTGDATGVAVVNWQTVEETAKAGANFIAASGQLVFNAGETIQILTVGILDNLLQQGDTTFGITLTIAGEPVELFRSATRILIKDDDTIPPAIGFLQGTNFVAENGTLAVVPVIRTGASFAAASATFATVDDTATTGRDYLSVAGIIDFAPGETNKSIVVPILDNGVFTGDRGFKVQLSNITGAAPMTTNAVVMILENESFFSFSANAISVAENATNLTLTVLRAGGTLDPASVQFITAPDATTPALAGVDYEALSGTLNFASGQTNATIALHLLDDLVVDGDKILHLILTNVVNAGLQAPIDLPVTIVDNDTDAGGFEFTSAGPYLAFERNGTGSIDVRRVGGTNGAVSVDFQTAQLVGNTVCGGTNALDGLDFAMTTGTLDWAAGEAGIKTILIPLTDDAEAELDKTFRVELLGAQGGAQLRAEFASVLATIISDDQPAGAADVAYNPLTAPNPGIGANGNVTALLTYATGPLAGRSIIVGDFTSVNAVARNRIARLNADGSVDLAFDPGSSADGSINAVALQSDGKIIIAGTFANYRQTNRKGIARLNADGTLDATFATGLGLEGRALAVGVLKDGKILVTGDFTSYDGVTRNRVARLNANGTIDTTLNPGLGADAAVYAFALDNATNIPVSVNGSGDTENRRTINTGASTGIISLSYNFTNALNSLRLYQGTTRIYDSGLTNSEVITLNADGSLSTNYPDMQITVPYGPTGSTSISIVINEGGAATNTVWRYSANIDPGLTRGIYLGGEFAMFNGQRVNRLVRLTATGAIDTTFDAAPGADGAVYAMQLLSNGSLMVAGDFRTLAGIGRNRVGRILSGGGIDAAFNPGTGVDGPVYALRALANGNVLIGGRFAHFNETARTNLARIYADGTLDTTFLDNYYNQTQPGPDQFVASLSVWNEGAVAERVLIGGSFSRVGGGETSREVMPRANVAQLIGGGTPGPGNIEIESAAYSIDENALSGALTVRVRRVNGNIGPIAVEMATVDDTALAGLHYFATNATLVWSNCDAAPKTFTVRVIDNASIDGNRRFNLALSNLRALPEFAPNSPAYGAQTKASVLILDDDRSHGGLAFSAEAFDALQNAGDVVIPVTRTSGSSGAVTVDFEVSDGTAVSPADYTAVNGTLLFASGQTSGSFVVRLRDQNIIAPDKTVLLRLKNPTGGAALNAPSNAVLRIINDNFPPGHVEFAAAELSVNEAGGTARIGVRRLGGTSGPLTVRYATSDGTGQAGVDYEAAAGVLAWSDRDGATRFFDVPILNNATVEPNRTVIVKLSEASVGGALGANAEATLTIVNDDSFGVVSFVAESIEVNENAGQARLVVARRAGAAEAVSVGYATEARSARSGIDFMESVGTLEFAAGEMSKTISIPIFDNAEQEGNRTFAALLKDASRVGLGPVTQVIVTITDDESTRAPAGGLDKTFDVGFGPDGPVRAVAIQTLASGEAIVAGGDFKQVNEQFRLRVARLGAGGELDGVVGVSTAINGSVRALSVAANGPITIGGTFSNIAGSGFSYLARLDGVGQLDRSFDPGSGPNEAVNALLPFGSAQILVGGNFASYNGADRQGLVGLNLDGSIDERFAAATRLDGTVNALARQPDGKALIGGSFTHVGGVTRTFIARLNVDGSLDATFDAGVGPNQQVRAIAVQYDGRIVIGGLFTAVNGQAVGRIARLNADGSVDATFAVGAGANAPVNALTVQLDGRIVAAGDFTQFHGFTQNRITRLNEDGSPDAGINFGLGADGPIYAVALQGDQKLIIGGDFQTFDGSSSRYLARVHGGALSGVGTLEFGAGKYPFFTSSTNAIITVRRNGGSAGRATVEYFTSPGTALPGRDYVDTRGTLVFEEGQGSATISVPILTNAARLVGAFLNVSLNNPQGAAVGAQTSTRLEWSVAVLRFSARNYSINENPPGGKALLTVLRTGETNTTVSAQFATVNGSATAPQDFTATTGAVNFAPGETTRTFLVPIINDALVEGDESFSLTLTNNTGLSTLLESTATVTIIDNDFAPGTLSVPLTNSVSESDRLVVVPVTRALGKTGVVLLEFTTFDGSARAGAHYVTTRGTLTFEDGDLLKEITIPLIDNNGVEGDVTFGVRILNPTSGAALGNATTTVTVHDNDFVAGSVDESFSVGMGFDGTVRTISLVANGSILAGGDFRSVNGVAANRLARVLTNGIADGAFSLGADRTVHDISLPQGGKVVVVGAFNEIGGSFQNWGGRVALSPALLDTTFRVDAGLNGVIYSVADYPTGKLMVGGAFNNPVSYLARLNNSGSLDVSFDPESGANAPVRKVLTQPDGSILIGGDFTQVGHVARGRMARLLPTGLLDGGFNPGAGANGNVHTMTLLGDGRILAGGEFTTFDGGSANRLVRLQANGLVDGTFATSVGANGPIYALALNENGSVYVGGNFTSINGVARTRVARLDANGVVDSTFDPGRGPDAAVLALAVQPDGQLLIGGSFTNVNGVFSRGLARLRGSVYFAPIEIQNARLNAVGQVTFSFTSGAGERYVIESSGDLNLWTTLATPIGFGATTIFTDAAVSATNRFYRVRHE